MDKSSLVWLSPADCSALTNGSVQALGDMTKVGPPVVNDDGQIVATRGPVARSAAFDHDRDGNAPSGIFLTVDGSVR